MRGLFRLVSLLAAALLIGGCQLPVGKPLLTYERNSPTVPKLYPVDKAGVYALFPGDGVTPLDSVYLTPGDKFGFSNEDGKVVGISLKQGQRKLVVLDAVLAVEYFWKYQGDKQP